LESRDPRCRHRPRARPFRPREQPGSPVARQDEDIAYAGVRDLSRWIQSRALTSERLTRIYLDRLERFQPKINATITLTRDFALAQARKADTEIAAGRYLGPLHGIPWGAKDLVDTAGIATTYGAEPFRNRVPAKDAAVVERLHRAGAVLVAKLSLGALALNDIWFGGETKNPWLLEEGASGSSAGPGAATASACVAFAMASETGGSIIAPAMRDGVVGLRPDLWARAPYGGDDAVLVAGQARTHGALRRGHAVRAPRDLGPRTPATWPACPAGSTSTPPRTWPGSSSATSRNGWPSPPPPTSIAPRWRRRARWDSSRSRSRSPTGRTARSTRSCSRKAAAAFEELTLTGGVTSSRCRFRTPGRTSSGSRGSSPRSTSSRPDRLRRLVAQEMARVFDKVDLLLVPSLRDEMLTISNQTGHPSLTLRAGFVEVGQARSDWAPDPAHPLPKFDPMRRVPHGVTLIGRLFDEGLLGRVGIALERAFAVADERPPGF
jgi:Asp-tRNA(Asn)/Glu-tRNA(Gln) amidotransferase A subunit family amidase